MRTKNAKAISAAESSHMALVKELPCSCCDAPGPSEAHHIKQGCHFATIPLCWSCHRGPLGLHGTKAMLKIRKLEEIDLLNITIGRLVARLTGKTGR